MLDVADLSAPLPQRLLWRGDDLPAGAGRIALPAAVETELDRLVAALDRDPLPLLVLRPEDFALDASRAFMREVKNSLDDGPGFAPDAQERPAAGARRARPRLTRRLPRRPVAHGRSSGPRPRSQQVPAGRPR